MPVPEAFLYDVGNVILRFDFGLVDRALRGRTRHAVEDVRAAIESVKVPLEAGELEADTFLTKAVELTGFDGTPDEFATIWQEIFTLNDPMAEAVESLASQGFPLFILSNTNDIHMDYILQTFPVFRHFNGAIYSYAERLSKPDHAIYSLATERFDLNPATTAYIDDLPANAQAGRQHGLLTHQYNLDDHPAFLRFLHDLGITV